jgi:prepilin-type N-terminal cleavage/methylation domain-containing protein
VERRGGDDAVSLWRTPPNERDQGISLVELLVTMMVMGVIIAATATLVIGAQRTNAQTIARLDQVESARNAVEHMSRTLRASVMPSQLLTSCAGCTEDAFVRGEDYEVQFYSNIDNPRNTVGPSRVTYAVTETAPGVADLVQTIQIPNSPIPTATGYQYCDPITDTSAACQNRVQRMIIARGVLVDPTRPLIAYYSADGTLATSGGALSAADLARVLAVEVQVRVQKQTSLQAQPTTYIQRILLPNAQAVIRQGEEEEE